MKSVVFLLSILFATLSCQKNSNQESNFQRTLFPNTEMNQGLEDYNLAKYYLEISDYDSVRFHAFITWEYAKDGPDLLLQGNIQMALANAHHFLSEYEEAKPLAERAL